MSDAAAAPAFASFADALDAFVAWVNEVIKAQANEHLTWSDDPEDEDAYYHPLEVVRGPRYIKLVKNSGNQRSVYGFVDRKSGNLLKAASWKSPAKNFARGSIFDPASYLERKGNFYLSIS